MKITFPLKMRENAYCSCLVSHSDGYFVPLCGYSGKDEREDCSRSCVIYDNDGPVLYSFHLKKGDGNYKFNEARANPKIRLESVPDRFVTASASL